MSSFVHGLSFGVLVGAIILGGSGCKNRVVSDLAHAAFGDYRITGPFSHQNLSVYLVEGQDRISGDKFIALGEALAQGKAVVRETSQVGELTIENRTNDENIYVQSGDIVKGGKQDRVMAFDQLISTGSGVVPVKTFCVEHGRWHQRQGEDAGQFASSENQLVTKDLKIAAKRLANQSAVWAKVSEAQTKLGSILGGSVQSNVSASSLELTIENDKVKTTADEYIDKLSDVAEGRNDVIGFAFAINGKIHSADVYASSALCKKLWPKLLRASAIEAIAEAGKGDSPPPTVEDLKEKFAAAELGQQSEKSLDAHLKMVTHESGELLLFDTKADYGHKSLYMHKSLHTFGQENDVSIHTNYLAK